MRRLPLYDESELGSALNESERLSRNDDCTRCELSSISKPTTVCMPAEQVGENADVLFVSEYPGRNEDTVGRPMVGVSGKYFRDLLFKWGVKNYVIDNAVKCARGNVKKIKPKWVKACRPYAAEIAHMVNPKRIICLGGTALEGVLGRRPAVLSIRKGYAWHRNNDGQLIPIFFTTNPAAATRNRFIRTAFEEDLKWALTCEAPKPKFDGVMYLVENVTDAKHAELSILEAKWSAYDVETHGAMHDSDFRVECVTFAPLGSKAMYTFTREAMRDHAVKKVLKHIVETAELVTSNGKFDDRAMLLHCDAVAKESHGDARLMSKMLDPAAAAKLDVIAERIGLGGHKLEGRKETDRVKRELKRLSKPAPTGLTKTGKPRKVRPPAFHVPQSVLDKISKGGDPNAYMYGYTDAITTYRYNARDADVTKQYARRVLPEFRAEPDISRVWNAVVRDANRAVRWIEYWGIGVDRASVEAFATYCDMKISACRQTLDHYGNINWNANQQIAKLLFDKLKLPRIKLTDSGLDATDADVLAELAERTDHPIIPALLEYRRFTKLDSTYATGMLAHIRDDGRVHTSYLLDGTGTGRMSSQDPNMQNIPRAKGSPDAKMARNCFVAPKGYVILESDFSQLELRIAAMLSGDKVMIDDYVKGIDIHSNNANELCEIAFGIPRAKWDRMTKDERDPYRSQVKTTTFGKLYGKTAAGLAAEFGCSVKQVEIINKKIWGRYRRLDEWTRERIRETRKTGEAWTWWDGKRARRRPLWGIGDPDEGVAQNAANSAINTPVQGTASDFCLASLWPICELFIEEGLPAKLVGTVHDSILVEVEKSALDEVAWHVKRIMESHNAMGVPIVAEQQVGQSWGDLSKYEAK